MFDFESPAYMQVAIERMRIRVAQRVSRQAAESISMHSMRDMITDDLVCALEAALLAEQLPPEYLDDVITFTVPRFATWRDHFRATYAGRWWARLLRLRAPRYADEQITHEVRVNVRSRWTYPQATHVLPGREFGHVVLKADASARGAHRWF